MARIAYNHPYINVAQKSVLAAGSTTVYQPDFKLGTQIQCDSGVYKYLQADGAVAEGYLVRWYPSNFDANIIDTTASGTAPTNCGICVASGGLADNQQGWFWLGDGEEYCALASGVTSLTVPLCTWTTSGLIGGAGSGDLIWNLVAVDSSTSSGTSLRLCRSNTLLKTNQVVAGTTSTG